jgi:stage V sporulation protein G
MDITEVRVFPRKGGEGTLKATASITFDKTFAVRDLKVIEGGKGLFVAMPSKKLPNGSYLDLAFPVTREMRDRIQSQVLEAYNRRGDA